MLKITAASLALFTAASAFAAGTGVTLQPPENSPECRDFVGFATQGKVDPHYISDDRGPLDPFKTDGIVVLKNGQPVYEWYDGVVNKDTSHIIWSASKMITATLLARTIQEGVRYQGEPITLETPVNRFFPQANPKLQLKNLVEMSSGYEWKEYYDSDLSNSSFLPMLYLQGHANMSQYALSVPKIKQGPGFTYNYSGGNANILMAILQKVYADNGDTAGDYPYRMLFNELGLEHARIEHDGSGHYIGSSYTYMSLRDMARVGQLYLQNGVWNGKQLLPTDWVRDAQIIPDGVANVSLDTLKKLGVPSKRIFWLNQNIFRGDGATTDPSTGKKILYPREMPEAPYDMYLAAGHYGQFIIILPSQGIVIARTGYDSKYWNHIQPMAVKALKCFVKGYKPHPVADMTPSSAGPKTSFFEDVANLLFESIPVAMKTMNYLDQTNVVGKMIAKEMCSFLFVMGGDKGVRGSNDDKAAEYLKRSGLPDGVRALVTADLTYAIDSADRSVTVTRTIRTLRSSPHSSIPTYDTKEFPFRAKLDTDSHSGCRLLN